MMRPASSRLWVCADCVRHSIRGPASSSWFRSYRQSHPSQRQRWFSATPRTSDASAAAAIPADHATFDPARDDSLLRELFDFPTRAAFSIGSAPGPSAGLFKNRFLTSPRGFLTFARRTLAKAERIVDKVLWASTEDEYRVVVRDLDRLSDLLCRVLDLSDFIRLVHPDARFQRAASDAWALVYRYMNQLNTMTGLGDQLAKALANPAVTSSWSEEEGAVARILQLDFMKSAIHLPDSQRNLFVSLSQRINEIGTAFCSDMSPATWTVVGPSERFDGLHPQIAHNLAHEAQIHLPSVGVEAAAALRGVHDEDIRREVYLASRTASRRSVGQLEELLALRGRLARLAGFESFGHMSLKDRMMAKSPASVMQFLLALHKHNAPTIRAEMADLAAKKRQALGTAADVTVWPWDRDYYMDKIRKDMRSRISRQDEELSAFFSVGTVIQGLSRLFGRLYGIRLVPRASRPGETWHPDVRRLDVVTDAGKLVAVIYCDLFTRGDRAQNPSHYTVRCSREISTEEIEDAAIDMETDADMPGFAGPREAANDGMETATDDAGVLKQLPTIALVCDFASSGRGDPHQPPPLLSLHQVETLFHEMGHAAHSILARTSLQNVSGTRCATDFAELPSTLMEHFVTDPSVLALFARHWQTDAPLPYEFIAERIRVSKRFDGMNTESQILLAMVDQAYHSAEHAQPDGSVDSTSVYHSIQRQYATPPVEHPATRWQGFFGHLHSYGSTYYSYLFDRVLAERVWRVVFRAGRDGAALDRAGGERLKENLLKWGGGRDPWRCLADTLGDERLASGDEQAMALVGSWGIKEDEPVSGMKIAGIACG